MTATEVAELLDVDPTTVTAWARAGKLVAIHTPGGHRRYLRSEVVVMGSGLHPDRDLDADAVQDSSDGGSPDVHDGATAIDPETRAAVARVVAEAVAQALEDVAAEAAEAARATAAAVKEAADRVADAAEVARVARASAADAAAQTVTADAKQAATAVRLRAEAAADRVREAAELAAARLADAVERGTTIDHAAEAELVEAAVQAAAETAAEETRQAAELVREAELVAAKQVAEERAAEETAVQRDVAAATDTQRELAAATAADAAAQVEARVEQVARVARDAAAAADTTRRVGPPGRSVEVEAILAAAEERDCRAELRDRAAEERERAASLRSFLADPQDEPSQRDLGLPDRRAAALDRMAAETDRARAAMDRAWLSAQLAAGPGAWELTGARGSEAAAELSRQLQAPLRSIVTTMTTLEAALRESEDHLRLVVDAVSDYAIITLHPDGTIASWNAGAQQLTGYTSEEALGRHCSILYPAEDREAGLPERLLERARTGGSCWHNGWRVRAAGSQFWADVHISAAHDDEDEVTGFVELVRDLTEQHQLEDAQDSFYNSFEHDVRVPLTAIQGFADLAKDADPQELGDLVDRVESNTNRLLGMVEELIDFARLRSGLGPVRLRAVDMTVLAQQVVADLASVAETSRVEVDADEAVRVVADPAALERVLANLLLNALKYSPADSEIVLTCELGTDAGVLRIADHGRGIDPRDLSSIFQQFERGRLAEIDSGTGLGLASVQRLVALQDGTITITSDVDAGTTVTVELPLAP